MVMSIKKRKDNNINNDKEISRNIHNKMLKHDSNYMKQLVSILLGASLYLLFHFPFLCALLVLLITFWFDKIEWDNWRTPRFVTRTTTLRSFQRSWLSTFLLAFLGWVLTADTLTSEDISNFHSFLVARFREHPERTSLFFLLIATPTERDVRKDDLIGWYDLSFGSWFLFRVIGW